MISGEPTKDIAIETRLFIPPERFFTLLSLNSYRPTSVIANLTYSLSSKGETPFNLE